MSKYTKNLSYVPTMEEENILHSLEYWVAEIHWLKKRGYNEDGHDMIKARKNVDYSFDCMKRYEERHGRRIPHWAVNAVIAWAEAGRYETEYFDDLINSFA